MFCFMGVDVDFSRGEDGDGEVGLIVGVEDGWSDHDVWCIGVVFLLVKF